MVSMVWQVWVCCLLWLLLHIVNYIQSYWVLLQKKHVQYDSSFIKVFCLSIQPSNVNANYGRVVRFGIPCCCLNAFLHCLSSLKEANTTHL